jgi:two-component system response regulator
MAGSILVVEDDASHAQLIRRAIQRVDPSCRIDITNDGVEAIEYLFGTGPHLNRSPADIPDLILLDLKMPRMGGLQVLQVLRRARPGGQGHSPPVVVLTSSAYEQDIVSAYNLGAHSYIQKPAGFDELVESVRRIVDYWIGLNTAPPKRPIETAG